MRRYIRASFCMVYSSIRLLLLKLFHFNNITYSFINVISPFTDIEVGKNSQLRLGKLIRVKSNVKLRVRDNAVMVIGNNTSLNHGCIVTAHEKIVIGDDVQFGPNVLIYDHDHDFRMKNGLKNLRYKTLPVEIGNNVWIGANVIILRGTKIGDNSVVGAGVVLQGEFQANSLIKGQRDLIVDKIN